MLFKKRLLIASVLILSWGNMANAGLFSSNKCYEKNGTLRIVEPENTSVWTGIGLSAPTKILRVLVNDSNCFTIVDRGAAFNAAQAERDLANSGILKDNHDLGYGQMKAADYVLVPDLISQNLNAGGSNINASGSKSAIWGSVIGGGSRTTHTKSAEVVLTLFDIKTGEQISSVTEKAVITDSMNSVQIAGNSQSAMLNGDLGFSNYSNTPIGKAIQVAYEKAYDALIEDIKIKNLDLRKYSTQQISAKSSLQKSDDPIMDFLTQYKKANTNEIQQLIAGLAEVPMELSMLNRMGLSTTSRYLTFISRLPYQPSNFRLAMVERIKSLSKDDRNKLIAEYEKIRDRHNE